MGNLKARDKRLDQGLDMIWELHQVLELKLVHWFSESAGNNSVFSSTISNISSSFPNRQK